MPNNRIDPLLTPHITKRKDTQNSQFKKLDYGEHNLDGGNKDTNTTGEKTEQSEFWKWMNELCGSERMFLHKEPLDHFPGVHPSLGPSLGMLRTVRRKTAEENIRVQLLEVLTRAYQDGVLTVPPSYVKIQLNGKEYTYEDLPEQLLSQALDWAMEKAKSPAVDDAGGEEASEAGGGFDDLSGLLGQAPMGVTAAGKKMPINPVLEGEDSLSMPEQTDNKIETKEGPRARKEIIPFEESSEEVEIGNTWADYTQTVATAPLYFFGT